MISWYREFCCFMAGLKNYGMHLYTKQINFSHRLRMENVDSLKWMHLSDSATYTSACTWIRVNRICLKVERFRFYCINSLEGIGTPNLQRILHYEVIKIKNKPKQKSQPPFHPFRWVEWWLRLRFAAIFTIWRGKLSSLIYRAHNITIISIWVLKLHTNSFVYVDIKLYISNKQLSLSSITDKRKFMIPMKRRILEFTWLYWRHLDNICPFQINKSII